MSDDQAPADRTRFREPGGKAADGTADRTPDRTAGRTSARTRFAEPRGRATTKATATTRADRTTKADRTPTLTKAARLTDEPVREKVTPAPAEEPPARRIGALAVVATVLAVVLLAATVVFAVLYVRARNDATALADTRTTVLRTAQKTAIDFSSYDYRSLDQDFAGVAAQLTPAFRKSYRSTAGALKATLSQYQAVGTAKVLDAGVSSLSANRAVVVVFLDQTVTSKTSKTPTVDRNRIRVSLQRDGSRWQVSKLDVR